MNKFLTAALKNARTHDYDEHLEYHLCAVIARGGSIISVGYNKRSTNSFVEHYTDKIRGSGRDYCLSTHAEMDAVIQARAKTDLNKCKIYVARIKKTPVPGTVAMARPCPICQNILLAYGIKRAYYTIDKNNFGVMRVTKQDIITVSDKEFGLEEDSEHAS